jgi:hypothetical protein
MTVDHCRSCRAPIVWATTEQGKAMPIDQGPVDNGNVYFIEQGPTPKVRVLSDPQPTLEEDADSADGLRYLSHFATCPQADQWRRS